MRSAVVVLVSVLLVCAGCTGGSESDQAPKPTTSATQTISLESLALGWNKAQGKLDPGKRPTTPAGYDNAMLDRMASALTDWARVAAVDDQVWHSEAPIAQIADAMPGKVASTLTAQTKDAVSPRLAVANVFGDDVTVVGSPMITTAWKVSTAKGESGKPYVLLELQTRSAYEVRLGVDGPTRVIGMLRVHGLSAFADTTDDFGVSGGWQEFGAGSCALALGDNLIPDSDPAEAAKDLKTFIKIGNSDTLKMPKLSVEEQVDAEYLKRCRQGSV